MHTVYEATYYIMIGKTKLCNGMNLDFYDLEDKDLKSLICYFNKTVRYKGKWFIVKSKTNWFDSEKDRDNYAENWIKYPYKKATPIK